MKISIFCIILATNFIFNLMKSHLVYRNNNLPASRTLHKQLSQDNISLKWGKWVKDKVDRACPLIVQWNVQVLNLYDNQHEKILKEISMINFPYLKEINSYNLGYFENLHALTSNFVHWQFILDEGSNKVVQIVDIKKALWPELIQLSFYGNQISEIQSITNLSSSKLKMISINSNFDERKCPGIVSCLKIGSKQLNQIRVFTSKRIKQKRINSKLNKKYKKIKIVLME